MTGDAADASTEARGEARGEAPDKDAAPAAKKRDKDRDKDRDKEREQRGPGPLEIELEVSRNRSAGWTVFGLLVGVLLVWRLGTVGVWVGIALIATGAYHAWQLAQTFLHPPGTIVVSDREVTLPRGLCLPRPITVHPNEVTAVYFLRRSVPWNRSAPVLIVELGARAMAFPRDWFASEADQRHIVHALMRRLDAKPAGG